MQRFPVTKGSTRVKRLRNADMHKEKKKTKKKQLFQGVWMIEIYFLLLSLLLK